MKRKREKEYSSCVSTAGHIYLPPITAPPRKSKLTAVMSCVGGHPPTQVRAGPNYVTGQKWELALK